MDFRAAGIQQLTDTASLAGYVGDESSSFHGQASAVLLPRTAADVCTIVARAGETATPVTVSGAGTSITGSRVPASGVVLSCERLRDAHALAREAAAASGSESGTDAWLRRSGPDHTILLAPEHDRALVPAGVRLSELDRLLAPHSLLYPPDPTEMTAMVGGTIATNASGARSYCYGSTREWIDALLVVTASGELLWVTRGKWRAHGGVLRLPDGFPASALSIANQPLMPETKHAAGYYLAPDVDLVDLLVGSEGTLAVVLAAVVRLAERPAPLLSVAGFFAGAQDAFSFADEVRERDDALSIEFFDGRSLSFIRRSYPDLPEAGACVLVERAFSPSSRHNPYPEPEVIERWGGALNRHRAVADWSATGDELRGMKAFRHALPEEVNRWVAERVGKLGTDMAVPASAFGRMHEHYREAQEAGVATVLFGHLGQHHLHLNFLPEDEDQMQRARTMYRSLARAAVSLGGTISAEHGVGRKHLADDDGVERPYLWYLYGPDGVRRMRDVKSALDPAWILNPGAVVPRT